MRHDPEEEWNQLSVEQTSKKAVTTHNHQQHCQPRSTPTSSRHHVDPSSKPQPNSTKIVWKYELHILFFMMILYLSGLNMMVAILNKEQLALVAAKTKKPN